MSLDVVTLGVWAVPCRSNWENGTLRRSLRAVGGRRAGRLLRPCAARAAVCSLTHFRSGLSLWGAPEAAPWATSCPCSCWGKGAAGEEPAAGKVVGGGRRSFAGRG